MTVKKRERCWT